jgi:hypothetical protein
VFILEIDLVSSRFSRSSSQVSDDETSTEARQIEGSAEDPSKKIMTPGTFDIKFLCGTQFTLESLTFAAGEDRNLKMLPPGPGSERLAPVYGQAPCFPTISSITDGAFSGLNPYVGQHIRTIKLVWGIPIVTSILQPSSGASSSSCSTACPDQDSADNYLKIGGSTCEDPAEEARLIVMVALAGGPSQNSSSRYPIIRRSEVSDARTPNYEMI